MKKLTLVLLFAGLTTPAWAQDSKQTPKPTSKPSLIEKAMQKFQESEAKNAEEMAAEMQKLQQSAKVVGENVKKAITPMAEKMKKTAEAEAPAIIDAVGEQSRANSKLVTGFLSALKSMADVVADEVAK